MYRVYLIVVIIRELGWHLLVDKQASLVCPCPCNIPHGIPTSSKDQSRKIKAFDKVDAVSMPTHTKVEAT